MLEVYINQYRQSAISILKIMLEITAEVEDTDYEIKNAFIPQTDFVVQIPFYGHISGDYFLTLEKEKWTDSLRKLIPTQSDAILFSCVSEYLNTVIGEAILPLQEDFEQLDLRLRGNTGALKQIILTLNPISDQHWIKKIFFDDPIDGVFTLKTTYLDNSFIDDEYKMVMNNKKKSNPRYYNIYALGNWGTAEGLIFNNVTQRLIREEEIKGLESIQGLDFGYTNDPSAFNQSFIDIPNKKLFIYDGFYEKGMSNNAITAKIKDMLLHRHLTTADSSEPKSIDAIKSKGVRIAGAQKGKDSINSGIDFLLDYEIILNAHLVEFMTEFDNYSWAIDKKTNKTTNKPVDDFNHFIDSLRYATEKYHAKGKRGRLNIDG